MVFNEAFVEQMRSALAADKARGREGLEAERIMYGLRLLAAMNGYATFPLSPTEWLWVFARYDVRGDTYFLYYISYQPPSERAAMHTLDEGQRIALTAEGAMEQIAMTLREAAA